MAFMDTAGGQAGAGWELVQAGRFAAACTCAWLMAAGVAAQEVVPRIVAMDATTGALLAAPQAPSHAASLVPAAGTLALQPPASAAALPGATVPPTDLGLRLRKPLDDNLRVDVLAWRRMTPQQVDAYTLAQQQQQPVYGARVELNLNGGNNKPGFVFDRGALGFQLEGGGRIVVRRSNGRPMVYYRTKF
jgi:hypothetical protein